VVIVKQCEAKKLAQSLSSAQLNKQEITWAGQLRLIRQGRHYRFW